MTTVFRKQQSNGRPLTPGELDSKTGGVYLSPGSTRGGDFIPAFKGGRIPASDAYHHEASQLHNADLDTRLGAGSKVFGNPMFEGGHAENENPKTPKTPKTPALVKMNSYFEPASAHGPTPGHSEESHVVARHSQPTSASHSRTPRQGSTPQPGGSDMVRAFNATEEEPEEPAPVVLATKKMSLAVSIRDRDKIAIAWEAELKHLIGSRSREAAVCRPAPSDTMIKCYVKRVKNIFGTHCSFQMHLENGDMFLLAARRRKKSKVSSYVISVDLEDLKRDTEHCMSKLKANFTGTEYMLWGKSEDSHVKKGYANEQMCINFKQASLIASSSGPRTMYTVLPLPEAHFKPGSSEDGHDSLANVLELARSRDLPPALEKKIVMLTTKPAEFDENVKAFTLDFKGRVKEASVKNFQLVHWDHSKGRRGPDIALQFGKIEDDLYALDFMYPYSIEVAFAVALASIDTKLCYSI